MPRPNVVFIFSDQQRADTMGHAGDPVAITPHLDQYYLIEREDYPKIPQHSLTDVMNPMLSRLDTTAW